MAVPCLEFIVLRFPELFFLECAFRNCQQSGSKQMDWYGCRAAFLFFSISGKATQFLKNWGPFSYGTCDFGKLTEWRWLGGKVLCVVFAGMMLAFVPKILKKRG